MGCIDLRVLQPAEQDGLPAGHSCRVEQVWVKGNECGLWGGLPACTAERGHGGGGMVKVWVQYFVCQNATLSHALKSFTQNLNSVCIGTYMQKCNCRGFNQLGNIPKKNTGLTPDKIQV